LHTEITLLLFDLPERIQATLISSFAAPSRVSDTEIATGFSPTLASSRPERPEKGSNLSTFATKSQGFLEKISIFF